MDPDRLSRMTASRNGGQDGAGSSTNSPNRGILSQSDFILGSDAINRTHFGNFTNEDWSWLKEQQRTMNSDRPLSMTASRKGGHGGAGSGATPPNRVRVNADDWARLADGWARLRESIMEKRDENASTNRWGEQELWNTVSKLCEDGLTKTAICRKEQELREQMSRLCEDCEDGVIKSALQSIKEAAGRGCYSTRFLVEGTDPDNKEDVDHVLQALATGLPDIKVTKEENQGPGSSTSFILSWRHHSLALEPPCSFEGTSSIERKSTCGQDQQQGTMDPDRVSRMTASRNGGQDGGGSTAL
jgi:hypothetical protein